MILRDLYPHTLMRISIQVLSNDGSILSCAINGISLALHSVGIQCQSIVAAITLSIPIVTYTDNDDNENDDMKSTSHHHMLLDPTLSEESSSSTLIHLAAIQSPIVTSINQSSSTQNHTDNTKSDLMKIVMLHSTGKSYTVDEYKYAMKLGKYSIQHLLEFMKQIHRKYIDTQNQ